MSTEAGTNYNDTIHDYSGLLAIQNSASLQDLSGFDELERVGMLVIAFLGNDMIDMDAFNSVHTVGTVIITRNMVCLLQIVVYKYRIIAITISVNSRTWRGYLDSVVCAR